MCKQSWSAWPAKADAPPLNSYRTPSPVNVDELAVTREMPNSRYDDIKSGKVKLIPGDEVEAHFLETA